jgi:hypothetical protein
MVGWILFFALLWFVAGCGSAFITAFDRRKPTLFQQFLMIPLAIIAKLTGK